MPGWSSITMVKNTFQKWIIRSVEREYRTGPPLPDHPPEGRRHRECYHHGNQYGEDYYSFVNGQHTVQGGTHLAAFREALIKTIRDFYKKEFDASDIRASIVAAISIKVEEPVFESQTKTKLGRGIFRRMACRFVTLSMNFVQKELGNYLHKNPQTSEVLLRRIQESERERKAISGIQKLAQTKGKKG